MVCNNKYIQLMHEYLDGYLNNDEEIKFRDHLQSCKECQQHFHELKRTSTLLKSNTHLQVSENFADNVMKNLPKQDKKVSSMKWFKAHPFLTAAAIFFILMFGSVFSAWGQNDQLSVSKDKNLVIQDDTVIVPDGVTVEGDLVVKNGDLQVDGSVEGDVVIINGEHLMASAGEVTGELEQVNQVFDWIWYHFKDFVKSIFSF